jgi:Ca2+-binding EF-hand superfamily protein
MKVVKDYVEELWHLYDADNSGVLDKQETMTFIEDNYGEISGDVFDKIFTQFDADNSGTIEKSEIVDFIM